MILRAKISIATHIFQASMQMHWIESCHRSLDRIERYLHDYFKMAASGSRRIRSSKC
jgi:hypothetical protein